MTSLSWFALSRQVRGLAHFCVPDWFALDYILIFPSLNFCLNQACCFLGLCWDTVHMSASLPPDKLADIQQLLLPCCRPNMLGTCYSPVTCLFRFQNDMLTAYHSPAHLFSPVHFSSSSLHQLEWLSQLQQSPVPLHFLMWLLLLMPHPLIGTFILMDLVYLYWLVGPGQVLCVGLILPCRSFGPLS